MSIKKLENPGPVLLGRLVNFSAQGTRLVLEQHVRPGTLVKIEWGGTVLLGEVVYCQAEGNEFVAGLELEDAIYGTDSLASMSDAAAPPAAKKA